MGCFYFQIHPLYSFLHHFSTKFHYLALFLPLLFQMNLGFPTTFIVYSLYALSSSSFSSSSQSSSLPTAPTHPLPY
jgi:hypothetical protein